VPRALRRPLVPVGADEARHLRFHQRLREHPDAFPQDVPILFLEELANERRQIHSGFRHRVNTSVSSFSGQRELTERCAMAAPAVYAAAVIEFPPRPGTLTFRIGQTSAGEGFLPVAVGFNGGPIRRGRGAAIMVLAIRVSGLTLRRVRPRSSRSDMPAQMSSENCSRIQA
jgi:hypothetical protein